MSQSVSIVFPHQLFEFHPALEKGREVWLIEEPLFFTQFNFHAQKLIYHRATMRRYYDRLLAFGYRVRYIESRSDEATTEIWMKILKDTNVHRVYLVDPVDYLLKRRVVRYANRMNIRLYWTDSPNFLLTPDQVASYFGTKKRFFLNAFYIDERKRQEVLVQGDQPVGGKWTFDEENRRKMPQGIKVPALETHDEDAVYDEAIAYVQQHFPQAWGHVKRPIYPIDRSAALRWLEKFCRERLYAFGTYQDAMHTSHRFGFHGVLTPMLNIGLLHPKELITMAIAIGKEQKIEINNIEGFVRQVMGWREYIRAVYQIQGVSARKRHFWNHHRPLPKQFWEGQTGIEPIDQMVLGLKETAYAHHIERLMVAGNFMLLCEIDPDEVYRWFMELFIDAYDWVMVPNVYGMSQFADGGMMSTKPYISGSNYLLKMSNFEKGEWCQIWDGLYWRFIHKHRTFFLTNPRSAMMVRQWDKMDSEKQGQHLKFAEGYLKKLNQWLGH
jgi:deoxyribodipyrimidine photolyase-related protein